MSRAVFAFALADIMLINCAAPLPDCSRCADSKNAEQELEAMRLGTCPPECYDPPMSSTWNLAAMGDAGDASNGDAGDAG